jgi:hypothetical protein
VETTPELAEVAAMLAARRLHDALRYLNSRTPHRFTGVYRYDGDLLRNEALFDRFKPELRRGDDVAMCDAYCALVGERREPLEFEDARVDGRFEVKAGSPVVSYCGVLIRDEQDRPFGTLCHYDVMRCQERVSDIPLLEGAAPLVLACLRDS